MLHNDCGSTFACEEIQDSECRQRQHLFNARVPEQKTNWVETVPMVDVRAQRWLLLSNNRLLRGVAFGFGRDATDVFAHSNRAQRQKKKYVQQEPRLLAAMPAASLSNFWTTGGACEGEVAVGAGNVLASEHSRTSQGQNPTSRTTSDELSTKGVVDTSKRICTLVSSRPDCSKRPAHASRPLKQQSFFRERPKHKQEHAHWRSQHQTSACTKTCTGT